VTSETEQKIRAYFESIKDSHELIIMGIIAVDGHRIWNIPTQKYANKKAGINMRNTSLLRDGHWARTLFET
jgi:hypothetical protein